ncbi:hypothetical protein AB205_0147700 [Aquarana catesbeiana]|uniref:Uncharacterized protein n=1 Tax=Aquarana catesbeiana TaxID=8400 RepID=A0A2G9SGA9_AQUCT|nr:hypothetical protein AB205_0147700 [Aquarana catesbeiana]
MFHITISGLKYLCAKYIFCFILIGEKRLRTSEDSRIPQLLKKETRKKHKLRMWRKERWWKLSPQQVSDVHVVKEQTPHFTTDSAQRLIQDIMYCSQDLDFIKQKTHEIEVKLKNMIDVLGRI